MIYRPEIDGLRAVAVIPVILFHAGLSVFGGGYVGVDVFFVISGYLITGIILEEISRGEFSILRFYERRARRILPALFVVVALCIPFAWFWMLPDQYADFTKSVASVSLFVSNAHFWESTGYFGLDAAEKPLLHTWSLAVEEQFYFLFPGLLVLLGKWRFSLKITVLVAIFLLSLALSEWGWRNHPDANFYFTFSRFWELVAGSICAVLLIGKSPKSSNLLSTAGLLLIGFSIFVYDEQIPFPSTFTLAPVVGTGLIILFGSTDTWTAKLLSNRVFVGIGLISYSAYLWHQPLFAFARIRNFHEIGPWVMPCLAMVTFGLAYLSWRYVEKPFRKKPFTVLPTRRAVFGTAFAGTAAAIALWTWSDNTTSFLANRTENQIHYLSFLDFMNPNRTDHFREGQCMVLADSKTLGSFDKDYCLSVSPDKRNYVLLGDSHAGHIWQALNEAFPNINIMQANANGCRPLLTAEGELSCTDLTRYILQDFIPNESIDGVILAARWQENELSELRATLSYLSEHVSDVVVIGPTVEYSSDLPFILGNSSATTENGLESRAAKFLIQPRFDLSELMARDLEPTDARYVSLTDALCQDGRCKVISNTGAPMAFDYGHFTISGARTVVDLLIRSGQLTLK